MGIITYLIFVLAIFIFPIASISCPSGFTLLVSTSRCAKFISGELNYDGATLSCNSSGGKLISIHNAIDNRVMMQFANSSITNDNYNYWLGLKCSETGNPNACAWADSTKFSYSGFAKAYPNTGYGNCVFVETAGNSAGQWFSATCNAIRTNAICEIAVNS
ncbi:C-type lectin domain-containing protein [Caenorhabditis elegans]|uniref:C-type lectin domain-containing protein n=1 Tax=Caenorhabditis elegans TaxID=6239 RepID=O18076_CAEEL|nr:C-type lectin domain-containing protein [Caenorhabditis elegans]CAB05809.1 C-type lectin domain-containing protein [Caenorhabditis elegans]|eukprot:NP_506744.1 C-type LECtin [Caenorhabditis elegans]